MTADARSLLNYQTDVADLRLRGYATHTPRGLSPAGFGWHLSLDLQQCEPVLISEFDPLDAWVRNLVELLDMKPYGEPRIELFGHASVVTSGYTAEHFARGGVVGQLIETSNITAHLSPHRRSAHVDVFSCKPFGLWQAVHHTEVSLGGRGGTIVFMPRG